MKTTKRMAGLLLMAFFLALTTSCAVEEDNGLFLIGVSDCLTDYPEDGGTYQGHGRLDTYVKTMQRASSGYTKQLVYMLDEESSRNSNYLQGEGNRVYLRGIEIKFDVPEGFPKIPKRFEPTNKKLEPGSRWLWGIHDVGQCHHRVDRPSPTGHGLRQPSWRVLGPPARLRGGRR